MDKGFHLAYEDLKPRRRFVVHPGSETFPLHDGVDATALDNLVKLLAAA